MKMRSIDTIETDLLDGAQLEPGEPQGHVDRDRTLEGDRLQCEGTPRTPNQNVDAGTEADADFTGSADIFTGECSRRGACGRCKYRPPKDATGANADIDTDRIERSFIGLWRKAVALGEAAFHRLMTEDDEADT